MLFPHELFQRAGLNSTDASNLLEVSRVTGWRWMCTPEGAGVNVLIHKRVQRVADAVAEAVKAGVLPNPEITRLAPAARAEALRKVLSAYYTSK